MRHFPTAPSLRRTGARQQTCVLDTRVGGFPPDSPGRSLQAVWTNCSEVNIFEVKAKLSCGKKTPSNFWLAILIRLDTALAVRNGPNVQLLAGDRGCTNRLSIGCGHACTLMLVYATYLLAARLMDVHIFACAHTHPCTCRHAHDPARVPVCPLTPLVCLPTSCPAWDSQYCCQSALKIVIWSMSSK